MRTKEIMLYKFDELPSDKAKERARDWFREASQSDEWWDAVYEDVEQIAPLFGIELKQKPVPTVGGTTRYDPAIYFSGFSSQGDGACFEGSYKYAKNSPKKIKNYAPQDGELLRIATELQALQKEHSYKLAATVTHSGRHYHKHSVSVEVMDGEDYASEETSEALAELLRDFMEWIYRTLEKEYEYQTSDEQVDESIRINEYEFDENGKRA